ncbi:MAG: metallophosphoesterase [Bacteroidales bacterium]|nr:metallophosphoesterase [Bacteroidales bacterium]
MKFFFFGILAAYLCGNVYIFARGLQSLRAITPTRRLRPLGIMMQCCFSIIFWIAALSFFVAMFARNASLPQWLSSTLNGVGSAWLVFTLYMVLALLVVDITKVVFYQIRRFLNRFGFLLSVIVVSGVLYSGYNNYRNPQIKELEIDLRAQAAAVVGNTENAAVVADTISVEDSGISVGKKNLKIVALSDVHLGYSTDKEDLARYVGMINSLLPDIVLIGGDLIDNSIVPLWEQRMYEELGQLKAPMGIYMVPGNHEYISGFEKSVEFLKNTPVVLLRDSVVVLPGGVQLVGRDDRSNRNRASLEELMARVLEGAPVFMLDHQPYELGLKDSLGVDIQFSGHTHRGQIWPMNLLIDRMYEQSHGYRKWDNSHVVVSSGLSLWGPPFRIGTESDLWVINVKL